MASEFDAIEEQVREIIAKELKVDKSRVRKNSTMAALGGDSLGALQLLAAIEAHFNISISDEEAKNILSFKAIVRSVKKHLKKKR